MITVKCTYCKAEFGKANYRIKRTTSGKHYCSRECYANMPIATQEKTGRVISCEQCSKEVYRSQAQLDRSKSNRHFCSKKCSQKYRSEIANLVYNCVCEHCQKPFHKSPGDSTRRFCSRDCWTIGTQSTGPSYYRKFKKSTCEECGLIPKDVCQLDIHHIDCDKSNNKKENLKTVCANCHRYIHKKLRDTKLEDLNGG